MSNIIDLEAALGTTLDLGEQRDLLLGSPPKDD